MPAPDSLNPHLWQKAASLAARFHVNQHRKDGRTPYVAHPFRVALVVANVFGVSDEVVLSAALLHDVIEDTPADYDDVARVCGPEVADLVAALTKDMRLPDAQREPCYDRQLAASPWQARLVKLADVYDNLSDASPGPQRRSALRKALRAVEIAEQAADQRLQRPIEAVRQLIARCDEAPGVAKGD